MTNLILYKVVAHAIITNERLYDVGTFSSESVAYDIRQKLEESKVDNIALYKVYPVQLDKPEAHTKILAQVNTTVPAYVLNAVKEQIKTASAEEVVRSIFVKSVHKVLSEIETCAENPEILKEYIQGLRDNVEDYL